MFTGIIESVGIIKSVELSGTNKIFWLSSPLSIDFKVDQSISHDGICLTVEEIKNNLYRVTAIDETIKKTNIGTWNEGSMVNIERCMQMNGRIDGHIVQGHVDTTAKCIKKKNLSGSWEYSFQYPQEFAPLVIEKGSIAINGTSLTIFNVNENNFTVAIIPYTYEHTSISEVHEGGIVNVEFDIIGKYVNRMLTVSGK